MSGQRSEIDGITPLVERPDRGQRCGVGCKHPLEAVAELRRPATREREVVVPTFTLDELEAVAAELSPEFRPLPVFAALTGLRPCEWAALERRDVDRQAGVVTVRRTVVDGHVKPYGKTDRSLRAVPLPARAAESLDGLAPRLDTRLLFPASRGGPIALQPGAGGNGSRVSAPLASSTGPPTRCGTPMRASQSRPASPCLSSPD